MKRIRTIIVDDEPAARNGVKLLLEDDSEIEIIALCKNGVEAIQEITENNPDLVLLDVQMPGIDGFDVLNNLPEDSIPFIVFITAHDQYAIKAFEYHAIDYLLKPFSDERFFDVINRVKSIIREKNILQGIKKMDRFAAKILEERKDNGDSLIIGSAENSSASESRIIIREGGKVHFIPLMKILHVEAYDYYVKIHQSDHFILARIPLKTIEEKLPDNQFIRIHRSHIINLNFVKRLDKTEKGDPVVVLENDTILKVSGTYKLNLLKRLDRDFI
jgi:two-component system LytT family response regulator